MMFIGIDISNGKIYMSCLRDQLTIKLKRKY